MDILPFDTNPFGGVAILTDRLPDDAEQFLARLRLSLERWAEEGYKLAWLELPIDKAGLIPLAVGEGFIFHHTGERYLMLARRLAEDAFIPAYATHYIGAGGVVLNERQELLVVCERHRRTSRPYYKLPGGALQAGEHLVDAVIREVLEETGIQTTFISLACFRHWHGYRHGKSDIYFVCRLAPLSAAIAMQVSEIEECLWMPVRDYLESELVSRFNKEIVQAALTVPGLKPSQIEGYAPAEKYEFFMP